DLRGGRGLNIQSDGMGRRSTMTVVGTRIERVAEAAIVVKDSDATIEGTSIFDVRAEGADYRDGRGVGVGAEPLEPPAHAVIRFCDIEQTIGHGIAVFDSELTLESTRIWNTSARSTDGRYGDALSLFAPTTSAAATVTHSVLGASA